MSQRINSRSCNNNEQRIKESNRNNCDLSQIFEEQCDDEKYTRYDPKELRDAARILSPFLKLTDEVNNPYARLVAQELCDTFYSLFYPNQDPLDVKKSFHPLLTSQKSLQIWNEIRLYSSNSKCKEWVPLCKEPVVEINEECDLCQNVSNVCPPGNMFDDSCRNFCDITPPNNTCDNSYQNFSAISPPDMFNDSYHNACDDHQLSAGSDSFPNTRKSKQNVQNTMSYCVNTENHKNYSRLCSEDIQDISDDARRNERLRVDTYLDVMSEETIDKNETDNSTVQQVSLHRQHAGNDVYLPNCEPGCSTDPGYIQYNNIENPSHYEYYRLSGNSQSPPRNANGPNVLHSMQTSPIQPELRTNALDDTVNSCECDDSDSGESQVNVNQIAYNAKIVANAFTAVSLAQQEVERKKNAFGALTKNYLNHVPNPVETHPPCRRTRGTRKMLKSVCKNPPSTLMPFNNDEWNDNCFRDKDFVRLLPFYEIVHNQLEYIVETQREYGFNMLDDIMSVFYHIHYDLGDPRLKNDMLIEHVKLVTKNTWESFFYPANQKMPAIPAKPDRYFSPSPLQQSMSQHLSPIQVNSIRASPRPSNQVPHALRQISPNPPRQENPPIATQKNFLRRSQPCGAPKNWVPKLKAVERPKEMRKFKAKPLPKFIRDRLNSRDQNC